MHRFHLPPAECAGPVLMLKDAQAHHASDVLRLRTGDEITVLDGAGHEYRCKLQGASKRTVAAEILERKTAAPPLASVTLIQGVAKGKAMDLIIQKATELGVTRIIPLLSERAVVHLDRSEVDTKAAKWQQIAIEAMKQCGQPWLPEVERPARLDELLASARDFELSLVGSLQPGSRHPRDYFEDFAKSKRSPPQSVALWIGPEGDFTEEEIAHMINGGALPITMGNLVLRCETAALYGLAVISYELQARR